MAGIKSFDKIEKLAENRDSWLGRHLSRRKARKINKNKRKKYLYPFHAAELGVNQRFVEAQHST